MRHISELFKELGFNLESPESTQRAFLKNLVKAAKESEQPSSLPKLAMQNNEPTLPEKGEQLCFEFQTTDKKVS